jgi:hypothetical protein
MAAPKAGILHPDAESQICRRPRNDSRCAAFPDPRAATRVVHGLDEIIRTRMLMIAADYEDGNDADRLRSDLMFKLAMGRLPDNTDLCSQPTISRFENLPDVRALLRIGRAMADHYCHSFRKAPSRGPSARRGASASPCSGLLPQTLQARRSIICRKVRNPQRSAMASTVVSR